MFVVSGCLPRRLALMLAALALALPSGWAQASGRLERSSPVPAGAETSVPFGWIDFCHRYRGECDEAGRAPEAIALTAAAMRKLASINAFVNSSIEPVLDSEHAGVVDAWDYPTDGKGDCEDYALLKRRLLIEAGFPRAALLLAVVKDEQGDGHSVLLARTNRGDFVLDNLADEIKPWTRAPYRFVKRQSQEDPNVWVAIGPPTAAPAYVSK
jgi:predicted transglutaminase-like cysteine proteinase